MSGDLHSAGVDFRRKMFELLAKINDQCPGPIRIGATTPQTKTVAN